MKNIIRIILIAITVSISAVYIPKIYRISFQKKQITPIIYYSALRQDFFYRNGTDGKYYDTKGEVYSTDKLFEQLPMIFYHSLSFKDKMPDTIQGQLITLDNIKAQNFMHRIRPSELNTPAGTLFPMYESNPEYGKLEEPDDFFRIKSSIEFIDAESMEINRTKSRLFNDVLLENGFVFPARSISGLPTTRKSKDEGYFIIDAAGQVFHLMMTDGKPICQNTNKPTEIHIEHIVCLDMKNDEFYAYYLTDNNAIYGLEKGGYYDLQLIDVPYNHDNESFSIFGNIFYRTITRTSKDSVISIVFDRDYQKVDSMSLDRPHYEMSSTGKTEEYLFPFTVRLYDYNSDYLNVYGSVSKSGNFIYLHIFLTLLAAVFMRKSRRNLKKNVPDLIIVLLTGIYGFIATFAFPKRD